MEKKNFKKKRWVKNRHAVISKIFGWCITPFIKFKYHAKVEKCTSDKNKRYLVLYNHQTAFDQFFIGVAFRKIYYVASEDLFSKGFISSLLRFAVNPIPIKKQTTDVHAVMNCLRVAREGGSIAIAPEGNRTFSGKTGYFKPSIVKLAKTIKLPIAIFRIEGGYGVQPRWASNVRKGKMRCYVKRVIEYDEYKNMSDDELYSLLKEELYVDESKIIGEYHHKDLANFIERTIYFCPDCGLSHFKSHRNILTCTKCGKEFRYLPNKRFEGVGFDCSYKSVTEWYEAQEKFVLGLDLDKYEKEPAFIDRARFSKVILYKSKTAIDKNAEISLYGNRIEVSCKKEKFTFEFDVTDAVTVLGRNKVNVYFGGEVFQIKGSKSFNGLKYVNIFNRYANGKKGENNEFLGL